VRKLQVEGAREAEKEKALAEGTVPDALLEEELEKDPVVAGYRADLTKLQGELEEIRRGNPTRFQTASEKTRGQIESVTKALESRREKVRPVLEGQLKDRAVREFKSQARQQRDRLQFLEGLEARLNDDVKRLDKDSRSITKRGLDLESLRA